MLNRSKDWVFSEVDSAWNKIERTWKSVEALWTNPFLMELGIRVDFICFEWECLLYLEGELNFVS